MVNAPERGAKTLRDGQYETIARLLNRVGGSLHDYAILPVAACDSPDDTSWRHCQPLLMSQLKALNPEKILVYGNKALQSVLTRLWGHASELTDRFIGEQIPCRELNAWVCPLGWINQKNNAAVSDVWAFRHAQAADRLSGRPYAQVPNYDKIVRTSYDPHEIKLALLRAQASWLTAFDYESTGLKPEGLGQEIVSCGLAWMTDTEDTECLAFPFMPEIKEAWCDYLTSRCQKVAANSKFEQRWSKRILGVEVRGWTYDTMLAAHMLNPIAGATGLKFQAFVKLGLPFYAEEVERYFQSQEPGGNAINNIYQASMPELLRYNAIDALAELDLSIIQRYQSGISTRWSNNLPSKAYYAYTTN